MTQTVSSRFAQSLASYALLSLGSAHALAQDGGAELRTTESANIDVTEPIDLERHPGASAETGYVLLGAKVGGLASFNGLDPFVHGAIEAGYVFPALNRGLGAYLQVEYSAPSTDGKVNEAFDRDRVPGGAYNWHIRQQELVLAPTFLYRLTMLSDVITPYVGVGPRIYLIKDTTRGDANGVSIDETTEKSTKWGLGLPLGAELALGPGKLIGELMFQWGPLAHTLTGDTHLGGASLAIGYRMLL
ncbi:MAG TPA: hypothetical protein VFN67_12305 [Polyangiales bacterium]|nr:hypothetical protein [Polyangiales bacterium]